MASILLKCSGCKRWWKYWLSFATTTSSLELAGVLENEGWQINDTVIAFAKSRLEMVAQSKIVEDLFCKSRAMERRAGMGGELSVRQVYNRLYTGDVLTGIHHFSEPEWRTQPLEQSVNRDSNWAEDMFHPPMRGGNLCLREVMSRKASWYSPSAATSTKIYAEMHLMVQACRKKNWAEIESSVNYGMLLRKPMLLIRESGKDWQFCLGEAGSNVLLVWPAEETDDVRGCSSFLPVCSDRTQVNFFTVLDPSIVEAVPYEWLGALNLGAAGKLKGDSRRSLLVAV
eukprot:6492245-Amphidinium_carterae.1